MEKNSLKESFLEAFDQLVYDYLAEEGHTDVNLDQMVSHIDYNDYRICVKVEHMNPRMGIDEILAMLDEDPTVAYHKLNMILWSLQELEIITFDEDKLDEVTGPIDETISPEMASDVSNTKKNNSLILDKNTLR